MNKQLFQYAVFFNPSEKQTKEGMEAEVIVEVKTVLAKDQNEVTMIAAMAIPEKFKDKLSQIQVVVRPF